MTGAIMTRISQALNLAAPPGKLHCYAKQCRTVERALFDIQCRTIVYGLRLSASDYSWLRGLFSQLLGVKHT